MGVVPYAVGLLFRCSHFFKVSHTVSTLQDHLPLGELKKTSLQTSKIVGPHFSRAVKKKLTFSCRVFAVRIFLLTLLN